MQESYSLERRECVLLVVQVMEKLPTVQKKVLAMYYFENMPLADIAEHLGLSKSGACQILVETSAKLFLAIRRAFLPEGHPDQQLSPPAASYSEESS